MSEKKWYNRPLGELFAPKARATETTSSNSSAGNMVPAIGTVSRSQVHADPTRVDPNMPIYRDDKEFQTRALKDYRYAKNADDMLMLLADIDPDVSAGVWNYLRLANSGIRFTGLDATGKPSAAIQTQLDAILFRLSGQLNFKDWAIARPVPQIANQMLKYLLIRGSIGAELVLGKDKRAVDISLVDSVHIQFKHPAPNKFVPWQRDAFTGNTINLDIPTFFWTLLDPKAGSPYETPPFLPVLQSVLFNISFMQDLERIVKRTAFPRISVEIVEATLRKFAPVQIQADEARLAAWLIEQKTAIGNSLSQLNPEDAAVFFDSIKVGVLEQKGNNTVDYTPLKAVIDQRIITGLKSLPTILGRQFGSSQTQGGIESLLYAKSIAYLQEVVSDLLSRILTLALRLEGVQGFCKVKYMPVNLKPENELEAFKTLKQARVLELLSLGIITDEEMAEELTADASLPPGYQRLSGTGFYKKSPTVDAASVASTRNPTASEQAGSGRQK